MKCFEVCRPMIIIRNRNPLPRQAVVTDSHFINTCDMVECSEIAICAYCQIRGKYISIILFYCRKKQIIPKPSRFSNRYAVRTRKYPNLSESNGSGQLLNEFLTQQMYSKERFSFKNLFILCNGIHK